VSNSQGNTPKKGSPFLPESSQIHQLPLSGVKGNPPASFDGLLACCNGDSDLADRVARDLKKHPEANELGFLPGEFTPAFALQGSMAGFAVVSGGLTTLPGDPHEILVQMVVRKVVKTPAITNLNREDLFACSLLAMARDRVGELIRIAGQPTRLSVDVLVTDKRPVGRAFQASLRKRLR
jgi:hypothetical protein